MDKSLLIDKIENWCVELTAKDVDNWRIELAPIFAKRFGYDENSKYIRIWYTSGNQKSVYAFVDYDGNIYKPAGWKSPAKGIRGHIDSPIMDSRELYKRGI